MAPRKIYLHIGHPKTGTTSIQTWFLANRLALRAAGILYPETGLFDSAHRLLSPSFYARRFLPNRAPSVMADLLREIISASCSTILISYEGFGLDHPRCLAPLKDLGEVTVLYYVRRQDTLAESMYAQHVRSFLHMEFRPPDLWLDRVFHCEYLEVAERFSDFFGVSRFRLRPFETAALKGGDVLEDILHLMHLTPPPGLTPPTSRNETLKRPYLAFKRSLNLLPLLESEHRSLARQLTHLSQADNVPFPRRFFSPLTRRTILERHARLNATLAKEWLGRPDGRLFLDETCDPQEAWTPLAPISASEQWEIFSKLSPENQAVLSSLYRPARLASPGDPLLPPLPDDKTTRFDEMAEARLMLQLQRRVALLESRCPPPIPSVEPS